MKIFKKTAALALSLIMAVSLCSCTPAATGTKVPSDDAVKKLLADYKEDTAGLAFDNTKWHYDSEHNVYWQISVSYCTDPAAANYENMAIYVPGSYLTGTPNSDGTYTCTLNTTQMVNGYTSKTAPIVMPINTGGYRAATPPSSYNYEGLSDYLNAGFIYLYSGCRGVENGYDSSGNLTYSGGAPWGVTDLKAAVRYYRFNAAALPGDSNEIYTFGHSGGGAQSSLMEATGDSQLYFDYLTSIGSAMYDKDGNYISAAITGAMCWCPIT